MINKMTIETAYRLDPYKSYYAIMNPKINDKDKKVIGIKMKSVAYKVKSMAKDEVVFEKADLLKDKKFPKIISFDTRYPDAENEILVENKKGSKKINKALKKKDKRKGKLSLYNSYALFIDESAANYNKLIRMHRLAEDMSGIYKAMKNKQDKPKVKEEDSEVAKKAKKGVDATKVSMQPEEVKGYFETIQATGYFEALEDIQATNPNLATR